MNESGLITGMLSFLIGGSFLVITYWGTWKMFVKAGVEGWKCLIPFYNRYCLYEMAMGKGWWFLLELIPMVSIIIKGFLAVKLAAAFGKGLGYVLGIYLLEPIFLAILGVGDATYNGVQ